MPLSLQSKSRAEMGIKEFDKKAFAFHIESQSGSGAPKRAVSIYQQTAIVSPTLYVPEALPSLAVWIPSCSSHRYWFPCTLLASYSRFPFDLKKYHHWRPWELWIHELNKYLMRFDDSRRDTGNSMQLHGQFWNGEKFHSQISSKQCFVFVLCEKRQATSLKINVERSEW